MQPQAAHSYEKAYRLAGLVAAAYLLAGCAATHPPASATSSNAVPSTVIETPAGPITMPPQAPPEKVNELIRAARFGQPETVELLLNQGIPADGRDERNNTALIAAAEGGHAGIIRRLVEAGVDVNAQNNDKRTALMAAAIRGDAQVLKPLLDRGAHVDARDYRGETALFDAVRYGHVKAVGLLLEAGANPNMQNQLPVSATEAGYTPLMYAAKNASLSSKDVWDGMVNELLAKGADPNLVNTRGDTALSVAKQFGNQQIAATLREKGARERLSFSGVNLNDAVIEAARDADALRVKQALDLGADPNAYSRAGVTPLLAAVYVGQVNIVILLMERGAKPNVVQAGLRGWALNAAAIPMKDRELAAAVSMGDTPLIVASRRGHAAVVDYLLKHNADPAIANIQREMPLSVAAEQGHSSVVRLLLSAQVDANGSSGRESVSGNAFETNDNNNPLVKAAQGGYIEIIDMLLDAGVQQSRKGFAGKTALHWSVERRDFAGAHLLLEHGADPNARNNDGLTPLMDASRNGQVNLVKSLLEYGADINAREGPENALGMPESAEGTGMTALMFAARGGHEEVVKALLEAGADVNARNNSGQSAQDIAVKAGFDNIVQLLAGKPHPG